MRNNTFQGNEANDFFGKPRSFSYEYDDKGHNLTWIEGNKKIAEEFAEANCMLLRAERGEIEYDFDNDDVFKIDPSMAHVTFAFIPAYHSDRNRQSYPLGYEDDPYDFRLRLNELLAKFRGMLKQGRHSLSEIDETPF